MATKVIRVLFFDFGNVCATFDFRRFTDPFGASIGIAPEEVKRALMGDGEPGATYQPFFERLENGELSPVQFFHELTRTLRCADKIHFEAFAQMWSNVFIEENAALDDLLARIPLPKYLLSNTNQLVHGRYIANTTIVRNHFAGWHQRILSYRVGAIKPDPVIYHEALRRADADPSECLFVDDLAENIAAWRSHGGEGIVYNAHKDSITMLRDAFAAHGVQPIPIEN